MVPQRHTRRGFLGMTGLSALGLALAACGGSSDAAAVTEEPIETGDEALKRLLEGNDRYVADKSKPINEGKDRREKVVKRQRPFALVFSCVDSRVPPELVFDRGLGDLFVARTAGEVLDSAVLGSIEYGVEELEIPLVLVLGHSACGAIKATVSSLASGERPPDEIAYLVDALTPAVTKAKEKMKPVAKTSTKKTAATTTTTAAEPTTTAAKSDGKTTTTVATAPDPTAELVAAAVQTNVELTIDRLSTVPILADRLKKDRLLIVGGVYNLETGVVDVTVNMPEDLKKERDDAAAKAKGGDKKAAAGEGATTTAAGATTTAKK